MTKREQLIVAVRTNADFAHSYFTRSAPSLWAVFPAGVCDSSKMGKAGWEKSVAYIVDGVEYEAFCKSAQCEELVDAFLEALNRHVNSICTVQCPECGELLEVPVSTEARHFRCSVCNRKFVIKDDVAVPIADIVPTNRPLRAKLIDDPPSPPKRPVKKAPKIYEFSSFGDIKESKDFYKFVWLFSLSPVSVKIATIFILIQVALSFIFGETTQKAFEFITLWLLGGILKGRNKSRWTLIALRGLVLAAVPFLFIAVAMTHSKVMSELLADYLGNAIATSITSIPFIIALVVPNATKWFEGHIENKARLDRIISESKMPSPFWKRLLFILAIVFFFMLVALGKMAASMMAS